MEVVSGSSLVLVNRMASVPVPPGSCVHLCAKCLSSVITAAWQSDRRTAGHDTRGTNISLISVWSEKLIREGYFPLFARDFQMVPEWQKEIYSRELSGTSGQTSPLNSKFDNT